MCGAREGLRGVDRDPGLGLRCSAMSCDGRTDSEIVIRAALILHGSAREWAKVGQGGGLIVIQNGIFRYFWV